MLSKRPPRQLTVTEVKVQVSVLACQDGCTRGGGGDRRQRLGHCYRCIDIDDGECELTLTSSSTATGLCRQPAAFMLVLCCWMSACGKVASWATAHGQQRQVLAAAQRGQTRESATEDERVLQPANMARARSLRNTPSMCHTARQTRSTLSSESSQWPNESTARGGDP